MQKSIKKRKKIAAILFAIGDDASSKILQHLSEQDLQILANEMAFLEAYSKDDLRNFLKEFLNELSDEGLAIKADPDNIRKILAKAFGEDKAKELLGKIGGPMESKSFYSLSTVRPQMIAEFIKHELPQTIAVILSHLEPTQAAEVLANLPENVQPEVVYRMATLESLSPEIIDELLKANNLEDIRKVSISQMELHSGPLPHPKILEGYKKIDKNAPKEIIEIAKREQKFRHSSTYFGQISALIIGIGGLTATTLLGIYGNAWVAGSIGFLSLGSLVGVFLYNSRSTKR